MEQPSVIVTGGAGYIGSHCCKALAKAGILPVVIDNFSTGHRDFVQWGPCEEGDIRDGAALDRIFTQYKPGAVIHFAALSLVQQSVTDPGIYWEVNVGGSLNLLQAMTRHGVTNIVFSSTAAVYGNTERALIDESHDTKPVNPYGATKLAVETMMEHFAASDGIRSVRLRYFNAAGANSESLVGEDHSPETHLIPLILDCAMGRRDCISVYGSDYNTADGTAVRDYVHVEDLASAHLKALQYLLDGGETTAVNLGSGQGASVAEVIAAARRVTGREIREIAARRRAGDPPRLVADPSRAAQVLKWEARKSDIETVLRDAWRWHRQRFAAREAE